MSLGEKPFYRYMFLLIGFIAMVLLGGCGSDGSSNDDDSNNVQCVGSYQSQLVFPDEIPRTESNTHSLMDADGTEIDCDAAGISKVHYSFYDNAGDVVDEVKWSCSENEATVSDISCGDNMSVVITAEDSDGLILLKGEEENLSITKNHVTTGSDVSMNVINSVEDNDGDGYNSTVDCDDNDPDINPDASEILDNDVDENCDGVAGKTADTIEFFTIDELGMRFNRISAGTFTMGSPLDETARDADEIPHEVTLTQDYFIQTTEVTQGQWEEIMGENPSFFPNCGSDCPVEQVSWDDVQEFIATFNEIYADSYSCRLPTEAEWEYAARAGTEGAFTSGDQVVSEPYSCDLDSNLDRVAYYCGNAEVSFDGCYDSTSFGGLSCVGTHPVGQKEPNNWGLYDMQGNVWEMVDGWYGAYPEEAVTDPQGPATGTQRMLRGGSWYFYVRSCRLANRSMREPEHRINRDGFRLICSQVTP